MNKQEDRLMFLVIGYGNPLRGDDGVASVVLEEMRNLASPLQEITFLYRHQLDIADAELIRLCKAVVFVDAHASEGLGDLELKRIVSSSSIPSHTVHISSPEELMHLVNEIYEAYPQAFLCAVKGHDFSLGAPITKPALRAAGIAAKKIIDLFTSLRNAGSGANMEDHLT